MSDAHAQTADRRWYVARSERSALAAAAGTYFLLLCGYYMLRSLREAIALEAGKEHIPLLFTVTFVTMLIILPAYWWIVARVRRERLFAAIYLPAVVLFISIAAFADGSRIPPLLAGAYFVLVTTLNLFIVSMFWSVMADVWRPGEAKRLFGVISAGGSAGALLGPAFNATFVQRLGVPAVIFIACAVLALAVLTGTAAQRLRARAPDANVNPRVAVGGRAIDDLLQLVRSPYLLAIAGFLVAGQCLAAFMYNEQARYVASAYTALAARAALFARLDLATNVLALCLQIFLVGWLTVRGGVRMTLTALWAIVGLSFAVLAVLPTGTLLLLTQIIRRAGDYGLFKPAREMLFTVLSPQSKFKSKSLIDTALSRGADSLGNGLYLLVAPLGLAGIAAVSASACVLLTMGARWLGAAFADRESKGLRSR